MHGLQACICVTCALWESEFQVGLRSQISMSQWIGVYMSGLEGDIKCKGAWCGFDVEIMKAAEGDVGI